MVSARMRPRFRAIVPCHPDKALDKFRLRLKHADCPYQGSVLSRHVTLKICPEQEHYWSPVLNIDAEPHEKGTLLRGHFGPHANVWTLFLALYAAVIFTSIFASMYGISQLMIGEPPWAFWSIPIAAVMVGIIYSIALMGQGLAQEQMYQLREFFDCSVCQQELEQLSGEGQCDANLNRDCTPEACNSCQSSCQEALSQTENAVAS